MPSAGATLAKPLRKRAAMPVVGDFFRPIQRVLANGGPLPKASRPRGSTTSCDLGRRTRIVVPVPGVLVDLDRAAVRLDDALREREAEADATGLARPAASPRKNAVNTCGRSSARDADAAIARPRTRRARRRWRDRELDRRDRARACTCARSRAGCRARGGAASDRRRAAADRGAIATLERRDRVARAHALGGGRRRSRPARRRACAAAAARAAPPPRSRSAARSGCRRRCVSSSATSTAISPSDARARLGVAFAGEIERDADARERRAQLVRDVREQLLLGEHQALDPLGHLVERARRARRSRRRARGRCARRGRRRRARAPCATAARSGARSSAR